jgi:hypothetical protein
MVRGSGIGHGSRDRSSGYGFPPKLDVCDPMEKIRNLYMIVINSVVFCLYT